ncbi:MAG TPA: ATP-binding protein [Acidimicrobiia bacterium]|nr:ATP-binding protein [Acidimicrobiia bacterium]
MEVGEEQVAVGRVIGTEDATPLEFWVGVDPERFLQLDDVVATERQLPGGNLVRIYGTVAQVRARHEGARFDSDVFLIERGLLPAEISEAAQVTATRFEPEVFVPPLPGQEVRVAVGEERDRALFFDRMEQRLPVGLSRDGEPFFVNLEFVDGQRGAHVNISGISGVATKTSYATFLLHSLFTSGVLGRRAINTKALIFNVKGEDLLFLDHANSALDDEQRLRYLKLGLPAESFKSMRVYAPPRPGGMAVADVSTRPQGVTAFFWTLDEFCHQDLLPFLFAEAEDERAQYTMVVYNVMAQLRRATAIGDGGVRVEGREVRTFRDLVDLITEKVQSEDDAPLWAGPAIGKGTVNAFVRRLQGSVRHVERLIRGDQPDPEKNRITLDHQVTVVDLHNLHDRAKRFVVGVAVRRAFEDKEASGQSAELLFLVLDELNKYAPREGQSPIKEILLDVAERGRSLGVILLGAQQTASEVERRIIANCSIRVVGRLDPAEASREEYGFLPAVHRQRATILKPGTMMLTQPELPVPLVLEFPFPAWATRASEAIDRLPSSQGDPFEGLS